MVFIRAWPFTSDMVHKWAQLSKGFTKYIFYVLLSGIMFISDIIIHKDPNYKNWKSLNSVFYTLWKEKKSLSCCLLVKILCTWYNALQFKLLTAEIVTPSLEYPHNDIHYFTWWEKLYESVLTWKSQYKLKGKQDANKSGKACIMKCSDVPVGKNKAFKYFCYCCYCFVIITHCLNLCCF